MNAKLMQRMLAVVVVLGLVLSGTGAAFAAPAAQTPNPPENRARVVGQIVSLADPDFVLRTRAGREVTVHTTGATQWHNIGGFGDLRVGMLAGAAGVLEGNGTLNARHVGVRLGGDRVRGTVEAAGDHSLSVRTPTGENVTVTWDAQTRCVIKGNGDSQPDNSVCSRIEVGDHLGAIGQRNGSTLAARWIGVLVISGDRVRGTVTATGDHNLTLRTPGGETITVVWNDATRCVIRGRGDGSGDNSACSRIQVGDKAGAIGKRDGSTLTAAWIGAFVPQQQPATGPALRQRQP